MIPLNQMVQADEAPGDPAGRDELIVSGGSQTQVFSGRPRDQWFMDTDPTAKFTGAASFQFAVGGTVTGLGDVTGDGKVRLSRKAVLEGMTLDEARADDSPQGGGRSRGGGNRGGGNRGGRGRGSYR